MKFFAHPKSEPNPVLKAIIKIGAEIVLNKVKKAIETRLDRSAADRKGVKLRPKTI